MNSLEASQVVEIIGSIYPNYNPMNLDIAIQAWQGIFADIPYKAVVAALYAYAKQNEKFPPTTGQVYSLLRNVTTNELDEAEAWNLVLKALQNGTYGSQKEFDNLPEDVQKAIGSPEYLRSLAMADDANLSVESSNFYRNYRAVKERRMQRDNMPNGSEAILEQMRANSPSLENKQQVAMLEAKENYGNLFDTAYQKFLAGEGTEKKESEPSETGESFTERLTKRLLEGENEK